MSPLLSSDFSEVVLPELPELPSMTSLSERRFLYHLGREVHSGRGAVVEIGTWQGGSSVHLAAGVRDSGHPGPIHCYDDFIWRPGMARKSDAGIAEGDSFFPLFEANTRPLADWIDARTASSNDLGWEGGPIEILVVDGPKSWRGIRRLFSQVVPHFLPGTTILSFQDYLHFPSYEIALFLATQDYLEPVFHTRGGTTVAFRVTGAAPGRFDEADVVPLRKRSAEEIRALFDRLLATFPPEVADRLAPACPMVLWDCGFKAEAEAEASALGIGPVAAGQILRKIEGHGKPAFAWLAARLHERMRDGAG